MSTSPASRPEPTGGRRSSRSRTRSRPTPHWFTALGAVQDAELWFYDQDDLEYRPIEFDEPLEVASCVGNVSLLDGERFAHTHVVLSGPDGDAVAGHLNEATVFAGEVHMRVFEEPLERAHDETTDLDLWL